MYIGVDLGGTTIKTGIVDKNGIILDQSFIATGAEREYKFVIDDIKSEIEKLINNSGFTINEIESIGIGIPGLLDSKTGNVIYCTNLDWRNVALGDELKNHFNKKVFIENDATVAGLAESLFGSTRNKRNSVFITLGTGIGGGIIINGKIYSGSHSAGSEIGHMIVGENFYDCNCGKNGCLETFASATALINYVNLRLKQKDIKTSLTVDNLNAKIIFDASKNGDLLAKEAVDRLVKYLSIGIVNLYNILDPDIIALGGGVSKAGDFLVKLVKEKVKTMLFTADIEYGDIVTAMLGNEAGILGAAFLGQFQL